MYVEVWGEFVFGVVEYGVVVDGVGMWVDLVVEEV